MIRTPTLTQEQISEMNKVKIIRLIKEKKVVTKLDLGKILGLSHTTVNTYIQMLIEEGIVESVGVAASNGGRKPMIVRLIPEARYSFGVSVTPEMTYVVLVDLLGEEILRHSFSYSKGEKLDNILVKLKDCIDQIIEVNYLHRERILGIGIVFPGLVNDDTILVEYAPNLGVKNYSLKQFQEHMGLKIYAENEANAAAYAEKLKIDAEHKGNLVYISIAEGIGTGIIIENLIYKGNQKKAGEFGHMRVSDEPLKCNCGRSGCWELFASKNALIRTYQDYKKQHAEQNKKQAEDSIAELFNAYKQGDPEAAKALEKYVRYLFMGIENILLAVNPDYVILGGDLGEYFQEVIDMGVNKLHLTEEFYGYENIKIYCSGYKDNGAIIGAALLPLEEIYNYQKNVI